MEDYEGDHSSSGTSVNTTEETISSYSVQFAGVKDGPFWNDAEVSRPYTMAGVGLTGEDEDPCKIDKIKTRELNSDDRSMSYGSGATINTTEETPNSSRNISVQNNGVTYVPYWDKEDNHPYTMAGVGLTGEDEDPCKIDKIKTRELDYDHLSREYGSEATINTTEETPNSFRNEIDRVRDGPYWDGEAESHPYTMAGIGLTGEDEDPCKIDKIKTRASAFLAQESSSLSGDTIESEDSTFPAGVSGGGQSFRFRDAGEHDSLHMYIQRLKNHPWKEVEYYRKSDSLFAAPEKKEFNYTPLTKLTATCYFGGLKVEYELEMKAFQDQGVEALKGLIVQGWLPVIPETSKKIFLSLRQDKFFRDSFSMIQYYKIGLVQMMKDQKALKGAFFNQFKLLVQDCSKLVKEYKKSIKWLKLNPGGQKVAKTVMTDDYRFLKTDVARNIRDYVIISQYIKGLNYINRSLCYLRFQLA